MLVDPTVRPAWSAPYFIRPLDGFLRCLQEMLKRAALPLPLRRPKVVHDFVKLETRCLYQKRISLSLLSQLNQVSAGIFQHGGRDGPHFNRRLRKVHAGRA
jgi:hypothetical protein